MTIRNYHFSFSFNVGRRDLAKLDLVGGKIGTRTKKGKTRTQRGYTVNVEVKAPTKKSAAQKIRNRIRKMEDVAEVPQFHYSEVVRGRPVLESEGHIETRMAKFRRGIPLPEQVVAAERESFNDADNGQTHWKEKAEAERALAAAMRRRAGNCSSF